MQELRLTLSERLLQHKAARTARCGRQPKQEELVMAKSQWTKAEPKGLPLIEIVCLVLEEAAQKVIRNKGAAGVDGITFEDLPRFLEKHGEKIKQKLRNGTYIPAPVKRVDIPKPNGGTRMLGIPTLLDRTIQQAIVMTIGGDFGEQFSNKIRVQGRKKLPTGRAESSRICGIRQMLGCRNGSVQIL